MDRNAKQSSSTAGVAVEPMLLSLTETAATLGISKGTLYHVLNRGELYYVRIGHRRLVPREAVKQFIIAHQVGPDALHRPKNRRRDGARRPQTTV